MVEWSERKEDHVAERYEREAAKASSELHLIIASLDTVMYRLRRL